MTLSTSHIVAAFVAVVIAATSLTALASVPSQPVQVAVATPVLA